MYGKTIQFAGLDKDGKALHLLLDDDLWVSVVDGSWDCCGYRYITCDDDISRIIGADLVSIECVKQHEEERGSLDYYETAFVVIQTDECAITLCTHCEHNGYYGGFDLVVREYKMKEETKILNS